MHLSLSKSFKLSPEEVLDLMTSRDFQQQKAASLGALEFGMHLTDGSAPTVVTRRKLVTGNLPEFIKPMLNPTMTVTETEDWDLAEGDGARTGIFTVDVEGAPVALRGSVTLSADGHGSILTFSGDLQSSVPLFRSKIEESAAGSVEETIRVEFDLIHHHAETGVGRRSCEPAQPQAS